MEIDVDNDKTLSVKEFIRCKHILEKWTGPIDDIEAAFYEIDDDRSG